MVFYWIFLGFCAFVVAEDAIIGIDFGTSNSAVGIYVNGKVEIVPNSIGILKVPSVVSWAENELLLGHPAEAQISLNPKNTLFDIKRLIGRSFKDKIVQYNLEWLPFELFEHSEKPYLRIPLNGQVAQVPLEFIASMIVTHLKQNAEAYLGKEVHRAVIGVPSSFTELQRQAISDTCYISGLKVERIINEPTGSAIAYWHMLDKVEREAIKNVLIFDLGGGTFDVSLFTIDGEVVEVVGSVGDPNLGGEDFTIRLVSFFAEEFTKRTSSLHSMDMLENQRSMAKLRIAAEKAKIALSYEISTNVNIEALLNGIDFSMTLSRSQFEDINRDLFEKTIDSIDKLLQKANFSKKEIHEIFLVGESTRVPWIKQHVQNFLEKNINQVLNTAESVAYGAAVQAAYLSGSLQEDVLVLETTPYDVGFEIAGGRMKTVIKKDSIVPVRVSHNVPTDTDHQTEMDIRVFQGNNEFVRDNVKLRDVTVTGVPIAPAGVQQMTITFDISVSGFLYVSANTRACNCAGVDIQTIQESQSLNTEELEELRTLAARLVEQDHIKSERIQARNEFETYLYFVQHELSGHSGARLSSSVRNSLIQDIHEEIQWLGENYMLSEGVFRKKKKDLSLCIEAYINDSL